MALIGQANYGDSSDAISYLDNNWKLVIPPANDTYNKWVLLMLDNFHKCFTSMKGKVSDHGRLLDIGTGPALGQLISASGTFSNIICADFSEENRDIMRALVTDFGSYDDFDWKPHIQYVTEKEGLHRDEWHKLLMRTQNSVNAIIPCDIRKANPIAPAFFQPFDCVTCHNVLDTVAENETEYQAMLINCVSLLRPRGFWVQTVVCGCKSYNFSGEYPVFDLSVNTVVKSLAAAGLTSMEINLMRDPTWNDVADYNDDYAMLVVKAVKS